MQTGSSVKWCNARSEKEGHIAAYYTSLAQTNVYRSGQTDVQNDWVKWNTGYRLPTEAEWEKAARGGASARRYSWTDADTITHGRANYHSDARFPYDVSPTQGDHPTFNDGVTPYTSPAGCFAANGYSLCDMAGNVWEWCWDWWASSYTGSSSGTDPHGASIGLGRVVRGGSWATDAFSCRMATRGYTSPNASFNYAGFRSVLPASQP